MYLFVYWRLKFSFFLFIFGLLFLFELFFLTRCTHNSNQIHYFFVSLFPFFFFSHIIFFFIFFFSLLYRRRKKKKKEDRKITTLFNIFIYLHIRLSPTILLIKWFCSPDYRSLREFCICISSIDFDFDFEFLF